MFRHLFLFVPVILTAAATRLNHGGQPGKIGRFLRPEYRVGWCYARSGAPPANKFWSIEISCT
jgi:hypothetical protein